ncbi:MAG: DUF4276 family protein [Bryobacterales bacterium]|nr:DUF4276 family protein [Bryobacterales bacterium]
MPAIDALPYDGRIPTEAKLRRLVSNLLSASKADHVIALTDVYTGTQPPEFENASDAKAKMRLWVGPEPRFHPHVAQYDFEAWLLPYWPTIQKLAKHNRTCPSGNPELVNHHHPPARRIMEMFEIGQCRDSYVKPRDAGRILRTHGLDGAVQQCAELRALVNTILRVSGGELIG